MQAHAMLFSVSLAMFPALPIHSEPVVEWSAAFGDSTTAFVQARSDGAGGFLLAGHQGNQGVAARIGPQGGLLWETRLPGLPEILGPFGDGWQLRLASSPGGIPAWATVALGSDGAVRSEGQGGTRISDWNPDGSLVDVWTTDALPSRLMARSFGSAGNANWIQDLGDGQGRWVQAIENRGSRGAWIITQSDSDKVLAAVRVRRLDGQGQPLPERKLLIGPPAIGLYERPTTYIAGTAAEVQGSKMALAVFLDGTVIAPGVSDSLFLFFIDADGDLAGSSRIDLAPYFPEGARNGECQVEPMETAPGILRLQLNCAGVRSALAFEDSHAGFISAEAVSPRGESPRFLYGVGRDATGGWVGWGNNADTLVGPVGMVHDVWWPRYVDYPVVYTAAAKGGTWTAHRIEAYRDTVWTILQRRGDCNCFFDRPSRAPVLGFVATNDGGGLLLGGFRKPDAGDAKIMGALKLAPGFAAGLFRPGQNRGALHAPVAGPSFDILGRAPATRQPVFQPVFRRPPR